MVDRMHTVSDDDSRDKEKYPDDERWTRFICPNGHDEKIEDKTKDLRYYCPECGERRSVEANHLPIDTTKTDKI
jgi:predicted RNA-binding Zn-ribbon protein involved in translation (DUF1610 family)